jgi:hypothetical protein
MDPRVRYVPLILAVVALAALAACSSPSPATVDRSLCVSANADSKNGSPYIATIPTQSGATPALTGLVNAFNAAVSADVRAENIPGNIGGTMAADIRALNTYGDLTAWCQSHGYGS